MGNENLLPKNIRQIGDIQDRRKICLEDYVMTYIRKTESKGDGNFLGLFLGERKSTEDSIYVFVRGIMEVPELLSMKQKNDEAKPEEMQKDAVKEEERKTGEAKSRGTNASEKETESEKENKQGNEQAENIKAEEVRDPWEQMKRELELRFPEWEIQGCCVIGNYPAGRLEELSSHFPEAGKILYHLQDQEERLYWQEGNQYEAVRGYFVFYEQNRQMQEYLEEVFGETSVEKEGLPDKAIRSFRNKVKSKTEERSRSFLKLASSFFVVGVLMIGVIAVNRVEDMRQVESIPDTVDSSVSTENQNLSETDSLKETVTNSLVSAENETEMQESEETLSGSDAFWDEDTETTANVSTNNNGADSSADADNNAAGDAVNTDGDMADSSADSSITDDYEETAGVAEAAVRQVQAAYVIQEGDTLASICARYYGSLDRLEELCEANEIEDANLIIPGQKLVLP